MHVTALRHNVKPRGGEIIRICEVKALLDRTLFRRGDCEELMVAHVRRHVAEVDLGALNSPRIYCIAVRTRLAVGASGVTSSFCNFTVE